jgi:hypothetical protein
MFLKGEMAMKQRDVILGHVYAVKVGGRIQPVRVVAESPYGGWIGRNEQTGREIRIRSAAKLRARLQKQGGRWQRALTHPQATPQADPQFQQELTDRGIPY